MTLAKRRGRGSLSFSLSDDAKRIFENLDTPSLLSTFFACKSLNSNATGRVAFQRPIHIIL